MPRLHATVVAGQRAVRVRTQFSLKRLSVVLRRYLSNNRKLQTLFPEMDVYYDLVQTTLPSSAVLDLVECLFPGTLPYIELRAHNTLRIRFGW